MVVWVAFVGAREHAKLPVDKDLRTSTCRVGGGTVRAHHAPTSDHGQVGPRPIAFLSSLAWATMTKVLNRTVLGGPADGEAATAMYWYAVPPPGSGARTGRS